VAQELGLANPLPKQQGSMVGEVPFFRRRHSQPSISNQARLPAEFKHINKGRKRH